MPFYVFAIQNPKLKTYSIKVHQDNPDFNTTGRTIINKFKNMDHYKKTKDDNYKLYNNADTKQELIFTQFGTSKKLNTPISIKKMIYNIIDKIKDDSIVNFLEKLKENKSKINMEYINAVKALIRLKDYNLLRNVAKTKEEIANKQQTIRDEKKGITDIQKDRVEKIIQKLLDDKEKPRMMTDIMIELIKEDENNRIIMNRMLDSKQMKSIRNKLTRMKKDKSIDKKIDTDNKKITPTIKEDIMSIKQDDLTTIAKKLKDNLKTIGENNYRIELNDDNIYTTEKRKSYIDKRFLQIVLEEEGRGLKNKSAILRTKLPVMLQLVLENNKYKNKEDVINRIREILNKDRVESNKKLKKSNSDLEKENIEYMKQLKI
tara:strand:- start:1521 stop:2642 length:1122 start_codon:yes stop_codon:yes gene_type:complete